MTKELLWTPKKAGDYTFQIQASDGHLTTTKNVTVHVVPADIPVVDTIPTGAVLIGATLLGGITYLFYKMKDRYFIKKS